MKDLRMVPAVEKAIKILNLFSENDVDTLGVTEIAIKLSLSKGTVHSILNTLMRYQIIDKNPATGKYSLGAGILTLSAAYEKNGKNIENFMHIAKLMRQSCLENINYSVLKGFRNLVLGCLPAEDHSLRVEIPVGHTTPSFCSSSGKVLICQMKDSLLERIFDEQYKQYTPNTISSKDKFIQEIHEVRENGYALNLSEYENGICSVGAPIKNKSENIIAALNIVIPEVRFNQKTKEAAIVLAVKSAKQLTQLGENKFFSETPSRSFYPSGVDLQIN